jgi:hypothetical protein
MAATQPLYPQLDTIVYQTPVKINDTRERTRKALDAVFQSHVGYVGAPGALAFILSCTNYIEQNEAREIAQRLTENSNFLASAMTPSNNCLWDHMHRANPDKFVVTHWVALFNSLHCCLDVSELSTCPINQDLKECGISDEHRPTAVLIIMIIVGIHGSNMREVCCNDDVHHAISGDEMWYKMSAEQKCGCSQKLGGLCNKYIGGIRHELFVKLLATTTHYDVPLSQKTMETHMLPELAKRESSITKLAMEETAMATASAPATTSPSPPLLPPALLPIERPAIDYSHYTSFYVPPGTEKEFSTALDSITPQKVLQSSARDLKMASLPKNIVSVIEHLGDDKTAGNLLGGLRMNVPLMLDVLSTAMLCGSSPAYWATVKNKLFSRFPSVLSLPSNQLLGVLNDTSVHFIISYVVAPSDVTIPKGTQETVDLFSKKITRRASLRQPTSAANLATYLKVMYNPNTWSERLRNIEGWKYDKLFHEQIASAIASVDGAIDPVTRAHLIHMINNSLIIKK